MTVSEKCNIADIIISGVMFSIFWVLCHWWALLLIPYGFGMSLNGKLRGGDEQRRHRQRGWRTY